MELSLNINNLLTFENILIFLVLSFFLIYIFFLKKEKKKFQKLVESKVEIFKKTLDISDDAILILSDKNKVLYANKAMIELLGLEEEFIFKPLEPMPKVKVSKEWLELDVFIANMPKTHEDKMQSFFHSNLLVSGWKSKNIPINLYIDSTSIVDKNESWCHIISVHNMSKEKENASAAYRHKLTNLPNQSQALVDLNALYAKIHLDDKKFALVLMDIDNFSQLRAIIGYEQANVILIKFAEYLKQLAKESSFSVYHTFHNNFLLSIPSVESTDEIIMLSKHIQKQLVSFYKMEDVRLHLTASVGISIYPQSGSTLNLLDNAYRALAKAQKNGFGHISIYKADISKHEYDEVTLYNGIHEAIKRNEFEVYYQPIVGVRDQAIVAAEALIRWKHPKYGYISPEVFIPIMEKTGFIVELGRYVLDEVLKQQKRWELFKFKRIEISINMSLLEIETVGFVENVERQLAHHQVDPELIKFEITEGSAMTNEELADTQFLALKKLGISLSLDDFGTGYTSFSYLKKFPASILKIDKTLVDNILSNQEDQRIIKAIIELGHTLGMKIVAEGIEDALMFQMIASYGCDYMQGYYFSKPLPVFEFQELLR